MKTSNFIIFCYNTEAAYENKCFPYEIIWIIIITYFHYFKVVKYWDCNCQYKNYFYLLLIKLKQTRHPVRLNVFGLSVPSSMWKKFTHVKFLHSLSLENVYVIFGDNIILCYNGNEADGKTFFFSVIQLVWFTEN